MSAGDKVEFTVEDDRAVLRRARSTNPFEKYKGALGGFPGGRRQMSAWLRGLRGR